MKKTEKMMKRNVTEGRSMKTRPLLSNPERKYKYLCENGSTIMLMIAADGKVIDANNGFLEMSGYSSHDIIGKNVLDFVVAEQRNKTAAEIQAALSNGGTAQFEVTFRSKDGSTRTILLPQKQLVSEEGQRSILVTGVDITERKRLEEKLKQQSLHLEELVAERTRELRESEEKLEESEKRLRTMFDSVSTGIMIIDPKTHVIVDANTTAIEMAGAPIEQIVGSRCHKYVCPAEEGRCPITDLGQTIDHAERMLLQVNGKTIPVMKSVRRIVLGGQEHLLESFIDLTERKKLEAQLAESQRLATIGETAAMVGHDLRNALQGIAGALYLLKKESLTAEERNEMLQVIEKSVHYSDAIIKDLSDYSAEIKLKLAEATPKSITRDAIEAIEVPQNVTVQDLSEHQPTLRVDLDRMRRVFINLIQNAIDAMPQGGTLTISSKKSDGNIEIALTDTGSGISEKVMENLWKPLQTTKAKGLGLGLAICKRIMDAHGGIISVESKAEEGTTMTIRLPIKLDAVEVKRK